MARREGLQAREGVGLGIVGPHSSESTRQLVELARRNRLPFTWLDTDLAGGAGYFDQAHLGREFRAFTGLTPTRYVEVRRRFLREHPGHALDGWPLPPINLGVPQSRGEPRGQGGHVQLGVGGRLHRG